MISKKMVEALNEQINKEIYSAFLYLAMSSYSDFKGLKGIANWFSIQYQEEMAHAMKIYRYVQEQGAHAVLKAIEQPPVEFGTPIQLFEKTLEHERFVTKLIHSLVDLAITEKDHATQIFLQWFVTEQIEEESNANEILDKMKLAGEDGNGLFMIDKELGARIYTPPAADE